MSVGKKIASAILDKIRARRETPQVSQPLEGFSATPRAKLREVTFSDFDGVMELRQRFGWASDSMENWKRIWQHNPALRLMKSDPPMGWVLEAEDKIVGYLGNVSLIYQYSGRTLTAVTGSGFVVLPAYRSLSVSLVAAFYRQKNIDLYLTTTAVEAVGKIARAFKSAPLPQAEYDSTLFWVLQPAPFAHVIMKKLGLKPSLSRVGGALTSVAVRMDSLWHRRWPSRASARFIVQDISVNDIGEEFQSLWAQTLKESPRLLADRTPETLRWHFSVPGDTGSVRVLCCYDQGELLGYAVVRHEASTSSNSLRRSMIADMLAKKDNPAVLTSLWYAAYEQSKQVGSHVFEVLGFPTNIREVSSQWQPYLRKYPALPFYYKAADPALHNTLSDGMAWYASPFDGDTTLWSVGSAS
jgi:hypothetical protein